MHVLGFFSFIWFFCSFIRSLYRMKNGGGREGGGVRWSRVTTQPQWPIALASSLYEFVCFYEEVSESRLKFQLARATTRNKRKLLNICSCFRLQGGQPSPAAHFHLLHKLDLPNGFNTPCVHVLFPFCWFVWSLVAGVRDDDRPPWLHDCRGTAWRQDDGFQGVMQC